MLKRKRPFDPVRVTCCGRQSTGRGLGRQIITFQDQRGGEFEATQVAVAVTCRKCRKHMERKP